MRTGSLAPILGLLLALVGSTGCDGDDGPTDPGLGFVDGGGTTTDTTAPLDDVAGGTDTAATDTVAPPPDVPADTGPVCFEPPGSILPVATGLRSSYTRGAAYPSLRQWADRARVARFRGLVFADGQRRTPNAPRIDQFSDSSPDYPNWYVYLWDKTFAYTPTGAGAVAEQIETYPASREIDENIQGGAAIRLRGVADGWARAYNEEPQTSFVYDVQDVTLYVKIAIPRFVADSGARVTLSYVYEVGQNERRLTWVFKGDPGDDDLVTDIEGAPAPGPTFRVYQLPLKDQILQRLPENYWPEGEITSLELRVDGDADVVFDEVRLNVDAWFADYATELDKYTTQSPVVLVGGVEHYFDVGLGQYNCVAPDTFPASEADPGTGLFADFAAAGCLTVAARPWVQAAAADPTHIPQADAVEVWHPLYPAADPLLLDRWDALLADGVRIVGLATSYARDVRELERTSPQNHVLAAAATPAEVVAAMAAGRLYLTDHIDVRASFWAERPDCQRAEMGAEVSDAIALHAAVTCPEALTSAKLVHHGLASGERNDVPVDLREDEAVVPVAGWAAGPVRLEAICESGARVVTNPIWLAE